MIKAVVVLNWLIFSIVCASAWADLVPQPPNLKAKAYVLVDHDSGQILAEKRADVRADPAEFTKLMTAYVIAQEIENAKLSLNDQANVSDYAWSMSGKRSFLKKGGKVEVEDLLKGMIVQSGNDAAVALAEKVAGNEKSFVAMMNQVAQRLGLKDTHFYNATGKSEGGEYSAMHYSTPRDLAKLGNELIRNYPELYKYFSLKSFTYNKISQTNRNKLLSSNEAVDGFLTSDNEGYAIMLSAEQDNMRITSVLLGAESESLRDSESERLINYGFRFFETFRIYTALEPVSKIRIWKGNVNEVPVGLNKDLYVTIPKGQYQKLDAHMQVAADLEAPVVRGQKLGYVVISLGRTTYAKQPIVGLIDVEIGNFWNNLMDAILMSFN